MMMVATAYLVSPPKPPLRRTFSDGVNSLESSPGSSSSSSSSSSHRRKTPLVRRTKSNDDETFLKRIQLESSTPKSKKNVFEQNDSSAFIKYGCSSGLPEIPVTPPPSRRRLPNRVYSAEIIRRTTRTLSPFQNTNNAKMMISTTTPLSSKKNKLKEWALKDSCTKQRTTPRALQSHGKNTTTSPSSKQQLVLKPSPVPPPPLLRSPQPSASVDSNRSNKTKSSKKLTQSEESLLLLALVNNSWLVDDKNDNPSLSSTSSTRTRTSHQQNESKRPQSQGGRRSPKRAQSSPPSKTTTSSTSSGETTSTVVAYPRNDEKPRGRQKSIYSPDELLSSSQEESKNKQSSQQPSSSSNTQSSSPLKRIQYSPPLSSSSTQDRILRKSRPQKSIYEPKEESTTSAFQSPPSSTHDRTLKKARPQKSIYEPKEEATTSAFQSPPSSTHDRTLRKSRPQKSIYEPKEEATTSAFQSPRRPPTVPSSYHQERSINVNNSVQLQQSSFRNNFRRSISLSDLDARIVQPHETSDVPNHTTQSLYPTITTTNTLPDYNAALSAVQQRYSSTTAGDPGKINNENTTCIDDDVHSRFKKGETTDDKKEKQSDSSRTLKRSWSGNLGKKSTKALRKLLLPKVCDRRNKEFTITTPNEGEASNNDNQESPTIPRTSSETSNDSSMGADGTKSRRRHRRRGMLRSLSRDRKQTNPASTATATEQNSNKKKPKRFQHLLSRKSTVKPNRSKSDDPAGMMNKSPDTCADLVDRRIQSLEFMTATTNTGGGRKRQLRKKNDRKEESDDDTLSLEHVVIASKEDKMVEEEGHDDEDDNESLTLGQAFKEGNDDDESIAPVDIKTSNKQDPQTAEKVHHRTVDDDARSLSSFVDDDAVVKKVVKKASGLVTGIIDNLYESFMDLEANGISGEDDETGLVEQDGVSGLDKQFNRLLAEAYY